MCFGCRFYFVPRGKAKQQHDEKNNEKKLAFITNNQFFTALIVLFGNVSTCENLPPLKGRLFLIEFQDVKLCSSEGFEALFTRKFK